MMELEEDIEFQRREWRIQRVGWAVMLLLVLGGALGLAGNGPLAGVTSSDPTGALSLHYSRFIRRAAPTTLELELSASAEAPAVWLDQAYLEGFNLRQVTPVPREQRLDRDRLVLLFTPGAAGGRVQLELEPQHAGTLTGTVGLVDGPALGFRQFVFP